jgi:hypothetical protein
MSDSARQQQFKYILRAAAGAYFEACQWHGSLAIAIAAAAAVSRPDVGCFE